MSEQAREARIAAARARRDNWQPDARPKCIVKNCIGHADPNRAGRCDNHWMPLRELVGTMAGEQATLRIGRRAFSEAMSSTAMPLARWKDLMDYEVGRDTDEINLLLEEATNALYAAGYYVGRGTRGGNYLSRRQN